MSKDLNSKEANQALMDYGLKLLQMSDETEATDNEWNGVEKIMQKYGVALLGDGNPTFIINSLLKEQRDVYGNKIRAFFGGFHLVLESHRKRGLLFAKSHLEDFFSSWRTSEGQLKWVSLCVFRRLVVILFLLAHICLCSKVMNPGDPNQINAELVMYVLGIYTSAIRALIVIKRNGTTYDVGISASDVVDHMISRAKVYPIIFVILIEIRFAEVIFMLHEAEREGNVDLYLTALKYLTPLFASAHATKYVAMSTDFLVEWFCKSDAEKTIFAEFVFTRKTKNGKKIYSDRFVEWMMKDLRMWCGNVASPHTSRLLETCALGLNRRVEAKSFGASELKNPSKMSGDEKRQLQIDHVYCEVVVFCEEANLFGPGAPRHVCKGKGERFQRGMRKNYEYDEGELSTLSDLSAIINPETLQIRSIGVQRLKEYVKHFLVDGDLDDPMRGEQEIKLYAINPLENEEQRCANVELARCATLDLSKIEDGYTCEELKAEIAYLRSILQDAASEIRINLNVKKSELCYQVKRLREEMCSFDSEWADMREADVIRKQRERGERDMLELNERIESEAEDPFYSLDCDVKDRQQSFIFAGSNLNNESDNEGDDLDLGDGEQSSPIVLGRKSYGLSAINIEDLFSK
jgi:hypothetical protein